MHPEHQPSHACSFRVVGIRQILRGFIATLCCLFMPRTVSQSLSTTGPTIPQKSSARPLPYRKLQLIQPRFKRAIQVMKDVLKRLTALTTRLLFCDPALPSTNLLVPTPLPAPAPIIHIISVDPYKVKLKKDKNVTRADKTQDPAGSFPHSASSYNPATPIAKVPTQSKPTTDYARSTHLWRPRNNCAK